MGKEYNLDENKALTIAAQEDIGEAYTATEEAPLTNVQTLDRDGNVWFAGDVESATAGKLSEKADADHTHESVPSLIVGTAAEGESVDESCFSAGLDNFVGGYCANALGQKNIARRGTAWQVLQTDVENRVVTLDENSATVPEIGEEVWVSCDSVGIAPYKTVVTQVSEENPDFTLQEVKGKVNYILRPSTKSPIVGVRSYANTAEGYQTVACGSYGAHVEGAYTCASGSGAHAEGLYTYASGEASHAEGYRTKALHQYSHAGGRGSVASGWYSFAHGLGVTARGENSVIFGQHGTGTGLFAVANGTSTENQSLALDVRRDGTVKIQGPLEIAGTDVQELFAPIASPEFSGTPQAPTPDATDDSTRIATTAYVQAQLRNLVAAMRSGDLTAFAPEESSER